MRGSLRANIMDSDFISGLLIGYGMQFMVGISEAFKEWVVRKLNA